MTGSDRGGGGSRTGRSDWRGTALDSKSPGVAQRLLKSATDQREDRHGSIKIVSVPSSSLPVRHLTEVDLARRWRMSVRTLQAWRWRKVGPPYIKAMGKVLYRLSDIEAFEADHLHGSTR